MSDEMLKLLKKRSSIWENYLYATSQYIELLLNEFNEFQKIEVLNELLDTLENIRKPLKKYDCPNLLTHYSILEARLLLIQGNIQQAFDLLKDLITQDIVKQVPLLMKEAEEEIKFLKTRLLRWKQFIKSNFSLEEKIEQINVMNYLLESKKLVDLYR